MSSPSSSAQAEAAEGEPDHPQVVRDDPGDAELPAGDAGEGHERADLDVVGRDPVLAAAQLVQAVDVHDVRADPLDRGAHPGQHAREVLHVRLGGGVADRGRARRQRGGHQRVLGAHHGRLVHEEVARAQAAVGREQADVAVELDVGAERAERVEVRVQPAPADHVAAGRRQQRGAEAGEQRAADEHRGADPLGEVGVDVGAADRVGLEVDAVAVAALDLHPEVGEQVEQRLGVADPRHIVEQHGLAASADTPPGVAARRSCSRRAPRCRERHAAFDDELLHEGWERSGAGVGPARKLG